MTGFESLLSEAGIDGNLGETIENMLNTYLTMMEELVESPEFETLVTPEAIATMFDQVPGTPKRDRYYELAYLHV